MSKNFDKFYENYSNKLKSHQEKAEIDLFLTSVQNLYPMAIKLFEIDAINAREENIRPERFSVIKKHVFENVIPNIESYDISFEKVTILENGENSEYPTNNPVQFINKYLGVTETTPYYYLILSYMLSPANYAIIQLCDK